MQPISPINFLHEHQNTQRSRTRRRAGVLAAVGIIAAILSSPTLRRPLLPPSVERVVGSVEQFSIFHLASSADRLLQGEQEDRINILLLGVGGENHDGAWLTDTIMLASLKPSTKQVALLSLPRDMVVPTQNGQWRKINSVHADAELTSLGAGLGAIQSTTESITGLTVPYVVRIDFQGFTKLIDELGGIDINVERTVEDYHYPILGAEEDPIYANRYEHLVIPKGFQHMDGELALKFVRSRYALGAEGSDFSRSRRQQQALSAVKEKVLSASTLLSPRKVTAILNLLQQHTATTFEVWEMLRLRQLIDGVDTGNIALTVLDDSPSSPLASSRGIDGAYILVPKGGNFERIQQMAQVMFEGRELIRPEFGQQPSASPTRLTGVKMSVEVLNGTTLPGYATRIAQLLETNGLSVNSVGNAPVRDATATIVYMNGSTQTLETTANRIARLVGGAVSSDIPPWLRQYKSASPIVIVLGPEQ
ncbi:LCP family protein [Candidatus Uhrbacteria bacterium]|nr:LCP family protein [Candidatus Uhrbacteria bacterium]